MTSEKHTIYVYHDENENYTLHKDKNQNNEKFVPTEEQIKAECQQRARYFWNWLTWSLVYYVVINLFLVAVNWFTSPHYWWVLWVIAGWGISLLITAIEKSIKY